MKLTEETIHGIASEHWITIVNPTRYALASTDFARAIESTVRQQDAELVRELAVVLQACNAAIVETKVKLNRGSAPYGSALQLSTKCEAALTRAQQWLEENQC